MQIMKRKHIVRAGFRAPARHPLGHERRSVMLAELVASLALALCTVVAATVLTVGIARAGVIGSVDGHDGNQFGGAVLLGLVVVGIGGLAARPVGPKE